MKSPWKVFIERKGVNRCTFDHVFEPDPVAGG